VKLTIDQPKVANECELKVTPETFEEALQITFPMRPLTEDELFQEFIRLFPPA